mmetsp:Transcript_41138/g.45970  ORF Transcript_41138/g.45970 Transcript_41138/m.45970 type:complete len:171 (-) Transcript_41138:205-717(-)
MNDKQERQRKANTSNNIISKGKLKKNQQDDSTQIQRLGGSTTNTETTSEDTRGDIRRNQNSYRKGHSTHYHYNYNYDRNSGASSSTATQNSYRKGHSTHYPYYYKYNPNSDAYSRSTATQKNRTDKDTISTTESNNNNNNNKTNDNPVKADDNHIPDPSGQHEQADREYS